MLVWKPIKGFLQQLTRAPPVTITCFFGDTYQLFVPSSNNCCANVYAINKKKEICYLGTAFNRLAFQWYRDHEANLQRQRPVAQRLKLPNYGPLTIVHNRLFCIIPTGSEDVNEKTVEQAVHRYFSALETKGEISISWLNREASSILDREIWRHACHTAKKGTQEEFIKKVMEDELFQ